MFLKNINFKQPKYMIPAIIYFPVLFTAYFVFDMFGTEIEEKSNGLETTEYLNSNLPQANIKDDGIGNRYENMRKSFGKIQDFTALDNIDRDQEKQFEEYQTRYSEDDFEQMAREEQSREEELERLREMQEAIELGAEKGSGMISQEEIDLGGEEERLARSRARQDSAMAELNRALEEARTKGRRTASSVRDTVVSTTVKAVVGEEAVVNGDAVHEIDESGRSSEVVKVKDAPSDYFNTIAENEPKPNMIKAIIDEDITAVNGSRVRLRLLDDVRVNDVVLEKGTYIYAVLSGFGSQRVKGNVNSVMVGDNLVKISLSIYDTDGLEGLYVTSSKFRETAKNIGSSAMTGSLNLSQSGGSDIVKAWGLNALNNAVQKTTNAVSSNIKQNKVKLKYGSQVYLINTREKKNQ